MQWLPWRLVNASHASFLNNYSAQSNVGFLLRTAELNLPFLTIGKGDLKQGDVQTIVELLKC